MLTITSCLTVSNKDKEHTLNGMFTKDSLENSMVFSLYKRNNILFAGTSNGIFEKSIDSNNNDWSNIGLSSDSSQVIDIIAWSSQEIMVAINYDEYNPNNEVILKTEDGGKNWLSYNDHFTGKNITNFLRRLALDINFPNKIFALGGLPVARSTDRGKSWKTVFETWRLTAFGEFIKIDPQNPNIIWSGGQTNIFSPELVKSTDDGDSWQRFSPIKNVEATVYDLVINFNNSNHVLVGMGGAIISARVIRKSIDGGQTWKTVFKGINTEALTHSARDPQVVYASGQNAKGTLFFAASRDFGDTWQTIDMPDSPSGIYVNDMVSVMQNGHEVLYLGTNKGVYSYTFEK